MTADRQVILTRLFHRLYGSPVVRNDLRGELVEELVAIALEPDWTLCGDDWGACDLVHGTTGARMQVKQSAAWQSWSDATRPPSTPRFSIAEKTGRWDGFTWLPGAGRNAEIFLFAWHPIVGDNCDHAAAEQWRFYVIPEQTLPKQKSVGLPQVARLSAAVSFHQLQRAVQKTVAKLGDQTKFVAS